MNPAAEANPAATGARLTRVPITPDRVLATSCPPGGPPVSGVKSQ